MTDKKDSKEVLRAKVNGWKEEKAVAEKKVEEEVSKNLAEISKNKALTDMYNESASMGSENIGGESLPLLKIHSVGRSVGNELANGKEPQHGYFFYKKTQEEFKDVLCHVLTISRGFRADGLEGKKNVWNQILGGVIIEGESPKPFLMYFTGSKLQNLWDFGKDASKWTKAKPMGIPMFALTVKLSSEKITEGTKQWFIVKFEISKDTEGNPELVTDQNEFVFLRDNVKKVEDMVERLIANKATEDTAQTIRQEGFDSAGRKIEDIPLGEEPAPLPPWEENSEGEIR